MTTIDQLFSKIYLPSKALVIYQALADEDKSLYVEAYDMDETGKPINAHPLAIEECTALSKALDVAQQNRKGFLTSRGILPEKVLYVNSAYGFAIWYTPPQKVNLLFKEQLSIPSGVAQVPSLIWKADKEGLTIYAVKGKIKPDEKTPLYYAPFFNLYNDGRVCMGTVDIHIEKTCCLEDFITLWERYFFESYFSHLIADTLSIKGNIVQLWQQQVNSNQPFPEDVLIKTNTSLKSLLP